MESRSSTNQNDLAGVLMTHPETSVEHHRRASVRKMVGTTPADITYNDSAGDLNRGMYVNVLSENEGESV